MRTKDIRFFFQPARFVCDGKCEKAWGLNLREKVMLGDEGDFDDYAFLSDDELGTAPEDPGSREGGEAKPLKGGEITKWCVRECERGGIFLPSEEIKIRDFSKRVYNKHWRAEAAEREE